MHSLLFRRIPAFSPQLPPPPRSPARIPSPSLHSPPLPPFTLTRSPAPQRHLRKPVAPFKSPSVATRPSPSTSLPPTTPLPAWPPRSITLPTSASPPASSTMLMAHAYPGQQHVRGSRQLDRH